MKTTGGMTATLRYEFRTQLRRPALWAGYGVATVLLVVPSPAMPLFSLDLGPLDPSDPQVAMLNLGRLCTTLLTLVFGLMVADRLVRDDDLRVAEVLESTPAGHTARLIGKYLGVCLATAVPYLLVYFGRALLFVATEGDPAALGWSAAVFAAMVLPGLLFVGALGMAGGLLLRPAPARVLLIVFWSLTIFRVGGPIPSLKGTLFDATGNHVENGLLAGGLWDGVNTRIDLFTAAQGWLWIALMVALTGALLGVARLGIERKAA